MVYTISLGKELWRIPFYLGKEGKRVYTMGPERVYTIEAPDPEEKEGFHGGGVYFFFPEMMSPVLFRFVYLPVAREIF